MLVVLSVELEMEVDVVDEWSEVAEAKAEGGKTRFADC